MKSKVRVLLSLVLAAIMICVCAAAVAENAPMTQGIYENRFTAEGRGEYVAYIHFYENGVYYISLYNGGQYGAGYYTLEDGTVDFFPGIKDGDTTTMTQADKVLKLTNLDGSEYATLGYDTASDRVVNLASYYNFNFDHIADSAHTDADENGINVIEYVLPEDDFCMVALKHNGTFEDSIDEIIEGTWTRDGESFVLTDEESGESYTVTVQKDGTALYVGLNGEEITLISTAAPAKNVVLAFDGQLAAAYGDMSGHVDCYDDGTLALTIGYAGVNREIEGSWALAEDYSKITFSFDGTEVEAPFDYASQTFSFEYPCSDGTQDVLLPFAQAANAAPSVVYTFVGENVSEITCTLLSDGTCSLDFAGLGTVTTGTWSIDTASGPLPAFTIELEDTADNAGVTVETDYATKFFFSYTNSSGTLTETLALSFADYQAAQ